MSRFDGRGVTTRRIGQVSTTDATGTGWWNAHRYDSAGIDTVTLTATDNTGHSTAFDVTITVV
ncbi:hypothetical protein NKF26_09290 [Haladaptatus sp. AB618]|uniref:hypothetical protein n=1 Tax=Haladaptatus sp. AB618 TaxID=2934173 RepID=UPI00209BD7EE|nr:hypothetical protein [Haladaptatus sp. AB618]MCO8253993.1 hypothetical protein [Haladaptatus sp. AB618]